MNHGQITVVFEKGARLDCLLELVEAIVRKPSSQTIEISSQGLRGASYGDGRMVGGRLYDCDVWLGSCRKIEGQ